MGSLLMVVLAALSFLFLVDSRVQMVSDAEWAAYKRQFNKLYTPERDANHKHYSSENRKFFNMNYQTYNIEDQMDLSKFMAWEPPVL